jgi:hypothetical protein
MSDRPPRVERLGDLVTSAGAAELLGIQPDTWRAYVGRGQAPPPDVQLGRVPLWRVDTVTAWHESRPGPGWWGPHPNQRSA